MFFSEFSGLAIEVKELSKGFTRKRRWPLIKSRDTGAPEKLALDNVSLAVRQGEMLAIVGLNGSGKSTLIRVLATLTTPDAGWARVFGADVCRQTATVQRHINRVSVEASFFKEMSPWENLAYAARLYGRKPAQVRSSAAKALRILGLPKDAVDRPMKQLSRGQQQKVAIARSLLTSPSLLLMDEPTTGLDPRSKREVQKFVATMHAESQTTVLVCTHDLDEAEALCDRVVVIDRGRICADASPAELRAAHGNVSLEDVFLRLTGKSFDDDSEDESDETAANPQGELVAT